jgi:hypothetical protein
MTAIPRTRDVGDLADRVAPGALAGAAHDDEVAAADW